MISRYPESDPSLSFPEDEQHMAAVIEAIRAIRNRRAEMNVAPSKKASVFIVTENKDAFNELTSVFFKKLASASDVTVTDSYSDEGSVSIITPSARIYIPLGELVDMEAERKRLEKEAEKMREEIGRVEKKLSNEGFVSKAPAAVIEGERKKLAAYKEKLAGIEETVKKFK